jgi:hypothetical protein
MADYYKIWNGNIGFTTRKGDEMNGWRIAEVAQLECVDVPFTMPGIETPIYSWRCKLCGVDSASQYEIKHNPHCPIVILRKEEEMADGIYDGAYGDDSYIGGRGL